MQWGRYEGLSEDDSGMTSALPAHCASEALAESSLPTFSLEASGDESSRDAWHPRLKRLYEYWKAIHPPRGLPGRQEFDPSAVPDLLPNLWMLDVQREPFRLRYRLVGTSIVCSAPGGLTGRWLDDLRPEIRDIPGYLDRHRAVVETKIPSWRRGPSPFRHDVAFASLENLFLPLARDGQQVDMILAETVYYRFDKTQF
jgi:hypothetical protein